MSQSFSYALKLAFGLTTLALVAYLVDLREVFHTLGNIDLIWLAVSFLCYVAIRVLMGIKWWVLLNGRNNAVSYATVQRALLLSDYHGLLFPNTFAIDAIRAVLMRHHPRGWTFAAASIAADRVINLGVAAAIALLSLLIALATAPSTLTPAVSTGVLLIATSVLAATVAVSTKRPFDLALAVLRFVSTNKRLKPVVGRVLDEVGTIHGTMRTMFADPRIMARALLLAIVLVVTRSFWIYLAFLSIGVPVDFHWVLALSPIITMIALLPITVLGLGLKDGAFVFFFSGIGVAASAALAVSFTTYAVVIGSNLCLGLLASMIGPALPEAPAVTKEP